MICGDDTLPQSNEREKVHKHVSTRSRHKMGILLTERHIKVVHVHVLI